jgi:DNA-binding PadR family transcriptional regulator
VAELDSKIPDQMYRRIITNFLDMVILMELRKRSLSGYDVISFAHNKFRILLSPGTVYSSLYSLERNGLVKGENTQRKRIYKLTEHGKEAAKTLSNKKNRILGLISNLFVT